MVDAVITDWRTAPIPDGLRATLGFLDKLTLTPDRIAADDVAEVRAAGVTDAALEDAVHVAVNFVLINKLADAFGWEMLSDETYDTRAAIALERGYAIPPSVLE